MGRNGHFFHVACRVGDVEAEKALGLENPFAFPEDFHDIAQVFIKVAHVAVSFLPHEAEVHVGGAGYYKLDGLFREFPHSASVSDYNKMFLAHGLNGVRGCLYGSC